MKTGVVIPAYNEHQCIAQLVGQIRQAVPDAAVVVVDDSPNELTKQAMAPLVNEQTTVLKRTKKGGRGSAVIAGIQFLLENGCQQIVEMDADFSHPPSQIPQLLALGKDRQADLVIASRYFPSSEIKNWPASRHIFSFFSNKLAKFMLRVPIRDYTNGFRCYSQRGAQTIVETCGKLGQGFIALSEILVNLYYRGFVVIETPTVFVNRMRGESSLNVSEIRGALVGLFKIYGLKQELKRQQNAKLAASTR